MSTSNGHPDAVTVTATRVGRPDRWVRLTLSLRESDGGLGGLSHAAQFVGGIEPCDDLAAGYELENWESGVLSGYLFACRRARRTPPPPLRLMELVGALGSEDMQGVVNAAAAAAAHLLGHDPTTTLPADPHWQVRRLPSPVVV